MKRILLALIPAFALATGCGTYSGLPADLVLGEMSDEEALKLCEATQRYNEEQLSEDERKTYACNFAASVAGAFASAMGDDFEEACTEAQSTCDEGDDEEGEEDQEDACSDVTFPEGCKATVEQFEACQKENIEEIKRAIDEFTCTEPESDDEGDDDDDGEKSACEIFREACALEEDNDPA